MKDEQKVVNEMITEILGSFDFATVRRVMDYMEWQWYQERDVPTIYAMMKRAEEQLLQAYHVWKQDGLPTEVGSGGFYATCDQKGNLTLRFVLKEAIVYRHAFAGKEVGV